MSSGMPGEPVLIRGIGPHRGAGAGRSVRAAGPRGTLPRRGRQGFPQRGGGSARIDARGRAPSRASRHALFVRAP
ncbi:hypothetical protein GCM10009665_75810 [Kitasatospora nipponensis]|uniref:Uncharacterized protein n=1 Tax=Kitasatospora nipponensis TaxID=258049 RepID=A0ABN1T7M7_9ACTN